MIHSSPPKFVQLLANRMVEGCVEPAYHWDEVEFYSVYLGEPGSYQWVADFEYRGDALHYAYNAAANLDCKLDRSQYDAVMGTMPLRAQ